MASPLLTLLVIGGLFALYLYSQGKLPIALGNLQLPTIPTQTPIQYPSSPTLSPAAPIAAPLPVSTLPPSSIPSATDIYNSETMSLPPTVKGVIIEIPNEAHEPTPQQRMGPKNGEALPLNIVMSSGASLAVLNGDAGHTHPISISGKASSSVPYTGTALFPSVPQGAYEVIVGGVARHAKVMVNAAPAIGSTTVGVIYVPTSLVPDFKSAFNAAGFQVISEHKYSWKVGRVNEHTVLVYTTTQDIQAAVQKLPSIAKMNTYT